MRIWFILDNFQAIHQTYEKYLYMVTPRCKKADMSSDHSEYIKVIGIMKWDALDDDLATETYQLIKDVVVPGVKMKPRGATENV